MSYDFKKGFFINLFKTLIIFLLIAPSVKSSSESASGLQLVTNVDNPYNPYNALVINLSEEQMLQEIEEGKIKQKQIDVSRSIAAYDTAFKQKYDGAIGSLISYFSQIEPSAKQQLLNIITNINNDLRNISLGIQNVCLDLMKISYEKGIFRSWNTLDSIDQTNKKIDEANLLAEERRKCFSNVGTSVLSVGESLVKGDVGSMVNHLASIGPAIWGLFSSTEQTREEIENMARGSQPASLLTLKQKQEYENKSYLASKLFCSFGYNLQLIFNETINVLDIIGDKIEYSEIVNLINVLEENLKIQITRLTPDAQFDENKKTELTILISTSERLDILKAITNKIADIINFSFKIHMVNVERNPSKDSINEIKSYFDNQLAQLNNLLSNLNEFFPKQRQQLEKEIVIIKATNELNTLKQDALNIKSNAESIINQRAADRYAAEIDSAWNATQTIVTSWFNIGESAIEFAGTETGNILGGLTKAIMGAVGQIPRELIRSSLDLVNGILMDLIRTPVGWIAISIPLFTLLFYVGQALKIIRVFNYGGERFIYIVSGTFLFLYRIVTTPVGLCLRPIGRFLFGVSVNNNNNNNDDNNPELSR